MEYSKELASPILINFYSNCGKIILRNIFKYYHTICQSKKNEVIKNIFNGIDEKKVDEFLSISKNNVNRKRKCKEIEKKKTDKKSYTKKCKQVQETTMQYINTHKEVLYYYEQRRGFINL